MYPNNNRVRFLFYPTFKKKRGILLANKKHPLENYFKEISEIKLLSAHEEIELAIRIKKKDKEEGNTTGKK